MNSQNPGAAATDPLDIAQVAKDTAKAAVEAASAQAAEFVSNVGDELVESAEKQKQQGADAIKGFARAIHRAGEEMDSQSPAVARQFHTAAAHVETLSDAIRNKSVPDLLTSASKFRSRSACGVLRRRGRSRLCPGSVHQELRYAETDRARRSTKCSRHRGRSELVMIQDRTIIRLITDVVGEISLLFQNEIGLVRAEIGEKISRLATAGTMIGVGAVAALATLFMLLQAVVKWLAVAGIPEQWGYLIVGLILAAVAAAVLTKGINDLKSTSPIPSRSLDQLRADFATVKEHVT